MWRTREVRAGSHVLISSPASAVENTISIASKRAALAKGLPDPDVMYRKGLLASGLCPFCRAGVPYTRCHHFWQCPTFHHCRPALLRELGQDPDLPESLRDNGVPPELAMDPAGPFWGGDTLNWRDSRLPPSTNL